MKFAVALFVLAVATSVPQVKGQNWVQYMMLQNLFGDSGGQSNTANTATATATGTTGTPSPSAGSMFAPSTGNGFDISTLLGGGLGGGQQSSPLFRMGAMTGTFGDQMQDMTYCSMFPRAMQNICMMRAMGMM